MREKADDQIDPIDDAIQDRKDYKSSGRMDSTRGRFGARSINNQIDQLEGQRQQVQDQLDRDLEADRQRRGGGQDASTRPGSGGQDASTRPGGAMPSFEEREAASGLNLAGNDPMSGRGQGDPTMDERESAAGLRGTTTGRDFSDETGGQAAGDDGELPDEGEQDDPLGTFGVIICINGNPHSASIYGQIGPKLT